VQSFQQWLRATVIGDLSVPATFIIVLALGFHFAGHLAAAAGFGVIGAGLVFLKYRAKRGTSKR
jgi:hypothetical protein